MKYFKLWWALVITMFIMGCELDVFFESAMPPDVQALSEIPEEYQGVYLCQSDSNQIFVYKRVIFERSTYKFIASIEKVKETENCSIADGGLYIPGKKECFPFEMINEDSLMAIISYQDTLFRMGPRQIAKEHKGRLFLNQMNEYGEWITFIITPQDRGELLWELIDIPDKEKVIEEITEDYSSRLTVKEEVKYILEPTLIEFEELIKQKDNLLDCDLLIPIHMEFLF